MLLHALTTAGMTHDQANTIVVDCSRKERAHLLEKTLSIALALLVGLIDLLCHQLLHLTHCSSIGDLNARKSRRQLGLRVVKLLLLCGRLAKRFLELLLGGFSNHLQAS